MENINKPLRKEIVQFHFVAGFCLVFLLASCSVSQEMIQPTPQAGPVVKTEAVQEDTSSPRTIHAADLIILHVVPGKEFEKELELTVNMDGEILVPLIGWIKVEGLTNQKAEEKIRESLNQDYLVNPRVSLRVKESSSRAVVMLGQLKKPGTYEFPQNGKMTLLEAVAKAEGFTDIANLKKIKVVRSLSGGRQRTIPVNGENMLKGDEPDLELQEGDLITVPESLF